jgi:hypothetical protein
MALVTLKVPQFSLHYKWQVKGALRSVVYEELCILYLPS